MDCESHRLHAALAGLLAAACWSTRCRDLDIWGQPSFWIYPTVFHRCPWGRHRQNLIPPFKRRDVSYTYRFEQHVLWLLMGSNEEEVARRLGLAA